VPSSSFPTNDCGGSEDTVPAAAMFAAAAV